MEQNIQSRFDEKETDKVNINWLSYPEGLGEKLDLQHYVLFYINVRGKSEFNKNNRSSTPVDLTEQNRLTPEGLRRGAAIGAGAAAGAAVFGGLVSTGGGFYKKLGNLAAGVGLGALVTAGAYSVTGSDKENGKDLISESISYLSQFIKTDQSYRISDVIALHVDERPSVRYSTSYSNKEAGLLGGLGNLSEGSLYGTMNSFIDGSGEIARRALINIAKVPGAFMSSASPGDLLSLASKTKTNPFREVFFEAVDFRTFNFKYRFLPKSKKESEQVQAIIQAFKFHMHPELSEHKFFYIYPSEFDIVYCYKGKENTAWHKISTCALTSMDVDYGGDTFSTFNDGFPTEINVSLQFQELEVLSKERIKEGY